MAVTRMPSKDSPFMLAWERFKGSQLWGDSLRAGMAVEDPKRVEGAMWAAFCEGYQAAGGTIFEETGT